MKKLLTAAFAATMLMPTMSLAGPPRAMMHSDLQKNKNSNVSKKPLCVGENEKFTERCDITIDETGVKGPEGHITKVVQWNTEDDKFNVGGSVAGAVAGAGAGTALGLGSCLIVGPLCLFTAPAMMGGGLGAGAEYGGNSGGKFFTVIGDDDQGNRLIQEFKYSTKRGVRIASKKLLTTTKLVEGETRK